MDTVMTYCRTQDIAAACVGVTSSVVVVAILLEMFQLSSLVVSDLDASTNVELYLIIKSV